MITVGYKTYAERMKEYQEQQLLEEKMEKEKYNIPNPIPGSAVNPMELDEEAFYIYCKMYLAENIYNKIIEKMPFNYRDLRNDLDLYLKDSMLDNLATQSGKIIVVNEIHSMLFVDEITFIDLDTISEMVDHIAKYDRRQYVK